MSEAHHCEESVNDAGRCLWHPVRVPTASREGAAPNSGLRRPATLTLIALVCVLLPFFLFLASHQFLKTTRVELQADLEGDGLCETLILAAKGRHSLTIWRDGERIWQGIPRKWRAWKLQAADVDGDGVKEIILGVHKTTRFIPEPHNCLFVFGWDGKKAFPKWLGSRLSKPFVDFAFAQLDGEAGEELVSLEVTRSGGRCLVVYSWCGFGFVGNWQSQGFARARLSRSATGQVMLALPRGRRLALMRKGQSYRLANAQARPSNTFRDRP